MNLWGYCAALTVVELRYRLFPLSLIISMSSSVLVRLFLIARCASLDIFRTIGTYKQLLRKMSCFPSYFAGGGYALLQTPGHGEENLETALKRDEAKGWSTKHVLLLCLSCVLFAGGLGSYVGMQLSYSQTDPKGDFGQLACT